MKHPRYPTGASPLKHAEGRVEGDAREFLEALRLGANHDGRNRRLRKRRCTLGSLLRFAGTWVGDDLEECLREVYASRSRMEL
jgi:hypothetical protein